MAIFRSLKSLISKSVKNRRSSTVIYSRTFFSAPIPIPSPFSIASSNTSRHILFRSGLLFFPQLNGPLFLSNPPWKLSQSATPLLLQSDVVLNFLKLRGLNLRYGVPKLVDADGGEDRIRDGSEVVVEGFRISDDYFNVPNLISFARLLSGPLLGWMIMQEMYSAAFIGLAISGVSDWLDGYVARKMRIDSVIGSYLDPLADKVLIGFVALAMVDKGLLHPGLVALVVLRDVSLVGGAVYKRAISLDWKRNNWRDFFDLNGANVQKVEPLFISKVNTVFQLDLVAGALLQPGFGNAETQLYLNYLSWLVASTTIASTAAYGVQHLRHGAASMNKSKQNLNKSGTV